MRPHRTLLFAALSIAACAGAEKSPNGRFDGGAAGSSGNSPCGPCPADYACVVATCVQRATEFPSPLAMEISPVMSANPQAALTEFPSISVEDRVFKTTASLAVAAVFDTPSGTLFPSTANAIVNVPSLIPGRPLLAFEATIVPVVPTQDTTAVALTVPSSAATGAGMLGLIPLPPADQTIPPHWYAFSAPTGTTTLSIPTNNQIFGALVDAFGNPKTGYTARAFLDGTLVSNVAALNGDGTFGLHVPAAVSGNVSVELAPAASADPWFTFNTMPLGEPNKNLGMVALPTYQVPQSVVFMVRGTAGEPVRGAALRASTILAPDTSTPVPAGVTRFWQSTTTGANGNANVSLIPGVNQTPRLYDVSVVPPPGSLYASKCVPQQPILGGGDTATIALELRPVLWGTVSSVKGTPLAGVTVTARRDPMLAKVCAATGPTEFSTTTGDTGSFSLPVDPGVYQLDFVPAARSPAPRISEFKVPVTATANLPHTVQLPEPYLIEGDVVDAVEMPLRNATIRIFKPLCDKTEGCTLSPILRAETQSDDQGHFRAIVALLSTN
jgi:hypothetical protein